MILSNYKSKKILKWFLNKLFLNSIVEKVTPLQINNPIGGGKLLNEYIELEN